METVRSFQLGAELRKLRETVETVGIKPDDACERLQWSRSKLDRIEAGTTIPKLGDLEAALDLYGADGATRGALAALRLKAKEGRRGWWIGYPDVFKGSLPALEQAAKTIRCFETIFIPGLAQTADYTRSIMTIARPGDIADLISKRVQARRARQDAVFQRTDPPQVHFILDEVALLRPVGEQETMRKQLFALLALAERSAVTMQVLPLEAGEHPAMAGSFMLLDFAVKAFPQAAIAEGQGGDVYLEGENDLIRLNLTWDRLAMAALSPNDSARRCAELTRK